MFVRKLIAVVLLSALMLQPALAWNAVEETDWSQSISGYVEAPNRGRLRYYAQNDPVWATMVYRFPHQDYEPRFSGAGCIPSALANCIANLLPPEELTRLSAFTHRDEGFFICPCSMNRLNCDGSHTRYPIATAEDFDRFFCLVVGSYLSGNNEINDYACGTMHLTAHLLELYGFSFDRADDNISYAAQEGADRGALTILMVAGDDCPFTSGSHALVLCDADSEYFYFLDSFYREEYPLDRLHIVNIITPGLVAVPRKEAHRLGIYDMYIVYPPEK